jgi:ABC-type dipeptide/oligopeptide/nickel transport system permease component
MGEFAAAMIKTGAQSSAVSLGAIGTVLLLLIYLPGARVLEMEARARQEEPGSTPERVAQIKEMLERHGFDKSMTQQIARVAQIFAPLLVAPMASLFGLIE